MSNFDSKLIFDRKQSIMHRKSHQDLQCQLKNIVDRLEFETEDKDEESVKKIMREKNFSSYKHCPHCWDGKEISTLPQRQRETATSATRTEKSRGQNKTQQ